MPRKPPEQKIPIRQATVELRREVLLRDALHGFCEIVMHRSAGVRQRVELEQPDPNGAPTRGRNLVVRERTPSIERVDARGVVHRLSNFSEITGPHSCCWNSQIRSLLRSRNTTALDVQKEERRIPGPRGWTAD